MLTVHNPILGYAGVDEAGRGALAGPVVAAAVRIKNNTLEFLNKIKDSKKLSPKVRNELYILLISNDSIDFGVAMVDEKKIDQFNILNATFEAMHRAILSLDKGVNKVYVDGNRFRPLEGMEHECIVKGDDKILSIAAASIIAKEYRDEYMRKIHLEYPEYKWDSNKGYGSLAHRNAIRELGYTPYHRKSFKLKPTQLHLDL